MKIILGLGSNIGNRENNIKNAIKYITDELKLSSVNISSMCETKALLPADAPSEWDIPFINAVMSGYIDNVNPFNILDVVKNIETKMGRESIGKWSPRIIDIDILDIGGLVIDDEKLTIPHKEMRNRDFVLNPLLEIEPDYVL